jgi:hypothetical protein
MKTSVYRELNRKNRKIEALIELFTSEYFENSRF